MPPRVLAGVRDLIGAWPPASSLSCPSARAAHADPVPIRKDGRAEHDSARDSGDRWNRHAHGHPPGRSGRLGRSPPGHAAVRNELARFLTTSGITVVEVDRPDRKARRAHGKSDPIDAYAAATAVLSGRASGTPKSRDGIVEAIRALRVVRKSAVKARTQTINQIRALMVTAPSALRDKLRGLPTSGLIDTLARFRPGGDLTDPACAAKTALRRLARRYQALQQEIKEADADLAPLVTRAAPSLVALPGVGTETAGQLLITAGDNPDRLRSEASFAHRLTHQGLRRQTHRRRHVHQGHHAVPEEVRRPGGLQAHQSYWCPGPGTGHVSEAIRSSRVGAQVRPGIPVRRHTGRPANPDEVAVLVLHDTLVHPPPANSPCALLSKNQRALRVLSPAEELAELLFLGVLIERREGVQVQEGLMPDILDGMDVDLV
ncbi:transposase [Streptomyces sp. NPDC059447]|uniref:IS110 family transposase n=1 Tax=Streptomyces sp. NPDC059447 TaxID=3346834 RepID=UPI00367608F6